MASFLRQLGDHSHADAPAPYHRYKFILTTPPSHPHSSTSSTFPTRRFSSLTVSMAQRSGQSLLRAFKGTAYRPSKFTTTERCRRFYSIHAEAASAVKLAEIDPGRLSITKTTTPKALLPPEELVFGRTFTGIPRHATIQSYSN